MKKNNLLFGTDNLVSMWDGKCVGFIDSNIKIDNFRGMCLQDSPAGVRTKKTISWPAQMNTASTFNRTLWTEYGKAYGNEFGWKDENKTYQGRDKSHWSDYASIVGTDITQDWLNEAVRRVLSTMYRFAQINPNYLEVDLDKDTITEETKKLNHEAAGQSNLLLKNDNNVLPLSKI